MDPQQKPSDVPTPAPKPASQFVNYRENAKPIPPVVSKPPVSAPPNLPVEPTAVPSLQPKPFIAPVPLTPPKPAESAPKPWPKPFESPIIQPMMKIVPPPTPTPSPSAVPNPTSWSASAPVATAPQKIPEMRSTPNLPPLPPLTRPSLTPQPARHSRRWLGVLAVVVLIILLGAGGVYALVLAPSSAIPTALGKIDSTLKFHTTFSVRVASSDKQYDGSSFSVSSDIDRTKPTTPSTDSAISLESKSFSGRAEIKLINNVLYGELQQVPTSLAMQLSQYSNKWYSISLDTLKTASAQYSSTMNSLPKQVSIKDTYDKLSAAHVFSSVAFVGFDMSSGMPQRKYQLTIDKTMLVKFSTSSVLTMILSGLNMSPITVTTDLVGGAIRSISFDITSTAPATPYTPAMSATVHIKSAYDPAQTDFTITAPPGATSLDSMLTDSMKNTQILGYNNRITSDIIQMRTAMEMIHTTKTGYVGGCTSATVKSLQADIVGAGSSMVCRETSKNFVSYAKLLQLMGTSTSPGYFCADSTGLAVKLGKAPAVNACK